MPQAWKGRSLGLSGFRAAVEPSSEMDHKEDIGRADTIFLRAVAILLVFNSHLDRYYPVPQFATGGAIGNSLFFALSCYGVVRSLRVGEMSFAIFCLRRILRLYPEIWAALLLYWLPLRFATAEGSGDCLSILISSVVIPPWWFLQVLLPLYPLGYLFGRYNTWFRPGVVLTALGIAYAAVYCFWIDLTQWSIEMMPFKVLSCGISFTFGGILAARSEKIGFGGIRDVALLVTLLILYFLQKLGISKGVLTGLQGIQQWLQLPIVLYCLKVSRSHFVTNVVMNSKMLGRGLRWLAASTLSFYMAHTTFCDVVQKWGVPFPGNVVLLLIITVAVTIMGCAVGSHLRGIVIRAKSI